MQLRLLPTYFEKYGRSLNDDEVDYNASEAARLFLLLGKKTLPVLAELSKSRDVPAGVPGTCAG